MPDETSVKESILGSVKLMLGYGPGYDAFDMEIQIHINSVFSTLNQLGVGPEKTFSIDGPQDKWIDFLGSDQSINSVKSYIYQRVRLMHDPPATSFAQDALKEQIKEAEFRLNVAADKPVRVLIKERRRTWPA